MLFQGYVPLDRANPRVRTRCRRLFFYYLSNFLSDTLKWLNDMWVVRRSKSRLLVNKLDNSYYPWIHQKQFNLFSDLRDAVKNKLYDYIRLVNKKVLFLYMYIIYYLSVPYNNIYSQIPCVSWKRFPPLHMGSIDGIN